MSLEVLVTGPSISVQDAGRKGWRRFGVSGAGPMDIFALDLANALCGNAPGAAALEFAVSGGRFRATRSLRIAVAGGACDIRIESTVVAPHESHRMQAGETLSIGALANANWGYLALSGGVDTPCVMGSRSTHLRFGFGGLEGRCLRPGDRLPTGEESGRNHLLRSGAPIPSPSLDDPIRVMLGPQDDHFSAEILRRLTGETFHVTPQRDRMATFLDGPALPALQGHDTVSDGTMPGAIQVPGSGKPIVLMAECQTTGGYPKIATVISADLPRLAQMPVGAPVRFATIERAEAEQAARRQHEAHRAILASLKPKPEGMPTSEFLLSCDLVGGIHDPQAILGR